MVAAPLGRPQAEQGRRVEVASGWGVRDLPYIA
jgi:hypothetical protein